MCLFMVQREQTMQHSNKFQSFYTYICWHSLWAYGCFDGLLWEATHLGQASHFNYCKANAPSPIPWLATHKANTHSLSLPLHLNLPHTVLACDRFFFFFGHHLTCCHGYRQGFIASQIQAPGPMHSHSAQVEWIILMPSQPFHQPKYHTAHNLLQLRGLIGLNSLHLFSCDVGHTYVSQHKNNIESQNMSGSMREGAMLVTMLLCECVLETKEKR